MTQSPDDLRDDLLSARLRAGLGAAPPRLSARLDRLAAAGLHADPRLERRAPFWVEVVRQAAVPAVAIALLAVLWPRLFAFATSVAGLTTPAVARVLAAPFALLSPGNLAPLLVPVAILLALEALRGAPTVWRWMR